MYEKLEKLRKDTLLEMSTWAGLSLTPGTEGMLITNDKKLYLYHFYKSIHPNLEGKVEKEYLSDGILIDDETYSKIINYIEEKIIDKKHQYQMIMDLSFEIIVKYQDQEIKVMNDMNMYGELRKIIRGEKDEKRSK